MFRITELGCSIGPNTFSAMQHVVEVLKENFKNNTPEYQIFFNDHVTNDFNTLFLLLPIDRSYYVYRVPGLFHGRLFPSIDTFCTLF